MLTQDRPTQIDFESLSGSDQLLLKRPILIKAVVTPLWQAEAQQQLQAQVDQLEGQLTELDTQVKQMIGELSKKAIQIVGAEDNTIAQAQAQILDIQRQANEQKNELLEQQTQVLEQLHQVRELDLGMEIEQGQIDSYFYIKQGDHLIRKMQIEVLLRDGVVEDIRGDL